MAKCKALTGSAVKGLTHTVLLYDYRFNHGVKKCRGRYDRGDSDEVDYAGAVTE